MNRSPSQTVHVPGVPEISSAGAFQDLLVDEPALLVYITGPGCSVCHALLPKVAALLGEEFPRVRMMMLDSARHPEISAQLSVLSIPTVLVYLDGHLAIRQVRHISISGLREELSRPYEMLFG